MVLSFEGRIHQSTVIRRLCMGPEEAAYRKEQAKNRQKNDSLRQGRREQVDRWRSTATSYCDKPKGQGYCES